MSSIFNTRLTRLQTELARRDLHAAAAIAGPNLYYLTGLSYHLSERPTVGLFSRAGDPVLVVPVLELEKTRAGLPYPAQIFTYPDADGPASAFAAAAEASGLHAARLGVEAGRMRVMELRALEAALKEVVCVPAEDVFAALRMVKDQTELDHMRRAVAIAQVALQATLPLIRVGMTERELSAELLLQTLRAGSDGELPFSPSVASGPHSALPHANLTDRALAPGDLLTLDWGAAHAGYASDLTRTFAVAERPSAELQTVHSLVHAANQAGIAAAHPAHTAADVDRAAREVITRGGYGDYFVHRVGHGLGLEGHEDPSMHGRNTTPLALGMTFTVEPGIYLPGQGGVRIEDDVVVGPNGGLSLSDLPRELSIVAA